MNYEPPEHLPPLHKWGIDFCPRCLMTDEEAMEKDCLCSRWFKDSMVAWAENHYWDSLEPNKDLIVKHIREGKA